MGHGTVRGYDDTGTTQARHKKEDRDLASFAPPPPSHTHTLTPPSGFLSLARTLQSSWKTARSMIFRLFSPAAISSKSITPLHDDRNAK